MGVPPKRKGDWASDIAHEVTLTKGFWIGKYAVTQQLFEPVIGLNPSENKGANLPVTNVSCNAGKWYAKKLNNLLATDVFRLPSEAEWEYACRAGTTGDFAGTGKLKDMGWFEDNSGRVSHPVGEKLPNDWGIHDMHGNIWECCDDMKESYINILEYNNNMRENHTPDAIVDPRCPIKSSNFVIRGGCFGNEAKHCTSAYRHESSYGGGMIDKCGDVIGFRLAANDDPVFFTKGENK